MGGINVGTCSSRFVFWLFVSKRVVGNRQRDGTDILGAGKVTRAGFIYWGDFGKMSRPGKPQTFKNQFIFITSSIFTNLHLRFLSEVPAKGLQRGEDRILLS